MSIITLKQLKSSLQAVKSYIDRIIPKNISELENDTGYLTGDYQPNWDAKETEPGHIANRTHWKEGRTTSILDATTVSVSARTPALVTTVSEVPQEGDTVLFTVGDRTEECIAYTMENSITIAFDDGNYYGTFQPNGDFSFIASTTGTYDISLTITNEQYHKLDNAFINLDDAYNSESENPIQNKVISETIKKLNNNLGYIEKGELENINDMHDLSRCISIYISQDDGSTLIMYNRGGAGTSTYFYSLTTNDTLSYEPRGGGWYFNNEYITSEMEEDLIQRIQAYKATSITYDEALSNILAFAQGEWKSFNELSITSLNQLKTLESKCIEIDSRRFLRLSDNCFYMLNADCELKEIDGSWYYRSELVDAQKEQWIITYGQAFITDIASKSDIPTKLSDLTNDSGFITDAGVTSVNGQTGDVTIAETPPEIFVGSTTPDGYTLYINPVGMFQRGEGASF